MSGDGRNPGPARRSRLARTLVFLYLAPLLFGLGAKLMHSGHLFGEFETVACAGMRALAGQPYYSINLTCAGQAVPAFVYLPGVAEAAGQLISWLSLPGFTALYGLLYGAGMVAMFAIPLFAPAVPGDWRQRLPFAALMTGGAVTWGNIAILLHGGILTAALIGGATSWVLVAAIVVAAWIKPVYLAYLAVIALADATWRRKIPLVLTGLIGGLLPTVIFTMSGSPLSHQWLNLLQHFVCDVTPGVGVLGWLQALGINGRSLLAQAIWAGFAAALLGSAVLLARDLKLNAGERLWLGLGLAALLIPRIMSQDVFLIGPGLLVLALQAPKLLATDMAGWERFLVQRGPLVLTGLCTLSLVGGLTSFSDILTPLTMFGFTAYLLMLGQIPLRRRILRSLPVRLRIATSEPAE